MWRVEISSRVLKDLRSLPPDVRKRLDRLLADAENGISELSTFPNFKRLLPRRDHGSFRLGLDHRAGVLILEEEKLVRILVIGPRENFYRRFPP